MDTSLLLWGLLFSSLGLGYLVYGRRQRAVMPLVCGALLMVMPYLLTSSLALVLVGAALGALPFLIRV